jgi:hypothetical protein
MAEPEEATTEAQRAAEAASIEAMELEDVAFDWDLVSLEQNNPRFNASVLSGFHSLRSPGVSPHRAWKAGVGILYSREEQVAVESNNELFDREQLVVNPKINYGLFGVAEIGAGFEAVWTEGKEIRDLPGGQSEEVSENEFEASAVGLGIKWKFLEQRPLRLALSFDSRIAVNRGAFGALPATVYNVELDGDYALTSRFALAGNLQFMTSDVSEIEDQVVIDIAGVYSFSHRFRGMLFSTAIEDDEADDVLFFLGVAGQYVYEQHSVTVAVDFQLNDARRDVRTQRQLDVELSYTITF